MTALGAIALITSAALAKPLEDMTWIEVRSEHFKIRSLDIESRTVELVHHLELLRAILQFVFVPEGSEFDDPKFVYVFRDWKQIHYNDLIPPEFFFVFDDENNSIMITDTDRIKAWVPVGSFRKHDYWSGALHGLTSVMLSRIADERMPYWFDLGIRKYFENCRIHGKDFRVGTADPFLLEELQGSRYPVSEILTLTEDAFDNRARAATFRAHSWILVHYLMTNQELPVSLTSGLGRYYQLASAGHDEIEAFELAFEIPVAELDDRLREYHRSRCCAHMSVPVAELVPNFSPRVTKMSRQEISTELAELRGLVAKARKENPTDRPDIGYRSNQDLQ